MKNQNWLVLQHLVLNGEITSMEAFEMYGITRLAARISELRAFNNIVTEYETAVNRYGETVRFAKYIYKGAIE